MNDKERIDETKTVHLYIAIRRTKENKDTGLKELCFRHVIRDEVVDLEFIKQRIAGVPGVWRIYKTINSRDVEEARKILICKLTTAPSDWNYRVDSLWKTTLLQTACKAERNFLIDVDTKDTEVFSGVWKKVTDSVCNTTQGPFCEMYSIGTPNGYHIVCPIFDTRVLEGIADVEFKRDGYVFIEKITNK